MSTNKFTRADIVKIITDAGVERTNAVAIARTIVQAMADALISAGGIELRGFGSLEVRERKTYTARNPQTGDPVIVPPRRRVVFRPGQGLKTALRGLPCAVPE